MLCVHTRTVLLWSASSSSIALPRVKVLPVPKGPMMRMGGRERERGAVMAMIASRCFGFSRESASQE